MSFFTPIAPMTFQNVLDWTIAQDKKDYVSPVKRCSELYKNRHLQDIPADLDEFKRRFPLGGFDPRHFKTEKAYKAWRRKVSAAIKGATGQLQEEQERRARQDAWAELIDALEPLTLKYVGDPLRLETALFAEIDPMDPMVEEICLLTDRLEDHMRAIDAASDLPVFDFDIAA